MCNQLGGIPLAIELAAASDHCPGGGPNRRAPNDSIRLLTTGNRTAPPRQQTLEATFDWSYRLLDPERADSPDGLAVFAGSWALEAAEAVCADAAIAAADVLDVLARLIEQPLVLAEAGCQSRRPRPGR
jgi:predicted ATPase